MGDKQTHLSQALEGVIAKVGSDGGKSCPQRKERGPQGMLSEPKCRVSMVWEGVRGIQPAPSSQGQGKG